MAHAGLQGVLHDVVINLRSIDDQAFCRVAETRVADLLRAGEQALAEKRSRGRRRTKVAV